MFDWLNDKMTAPGFLAGAALATGNGFGGMMQGIQGGAAMAKMKAEAERAKQFNLMFQGDRPEWGKGDMAGIYDLARVLGPEQGGQMLGQGMMRMPEQRLARDRFGHEQRIDYDRLRQQMIMQGQNQALERERLAEAKRHHGVQEQASRMQTPDERMRVAETLNIPRGSPQWQQYVATGQMTRPNPMDETMARLLQGIDAGASQQPQRQPTPAPGLTPQSAPVQPDGQLIPTQATAPQNAPAAAPVEPPDMVQTPLGAMTRERARTLGFAMALGGKGDAGKMMADSPSKLGTEAQNDVEKQLIGRMTDLAELQDIKSAFKPEFQSLYGKAIATKKSWESFVKGGLSKDDAAGLRAFAEHRSLGFERLNNRIKTMSGTAVSGQEEQRMLKANPNPGTGILDGDDPDTYSAKLDNAIKMQRAAIMRYNFLRTKGLNAAQISDLAKSGRIEGFMSLNDVENAYKKRGQEITDELRKAHPQASPDEILNGARMRTRQEFGI